MDKQKVIKISFKKLITIIIVVSVFFLSIIIGMSFRKTVTVSSDIESDVKEISQVATTNSKKMKRDNEESIWKITENKEIQLKSNSENDKKEEENINEKNDSNENNAEKQQEEKDKDNKQNNTGSIFLTFDDGPTTSSTPRILEILKEENVKATFFILNYDDEGEKLVKQEHEEGHSVAIHGYSHEYKDIYYSDEAYMENLNKLREKIQSSIGIKAIATRFPGGSSNTISRRYNKNIMSRLVEEVQQAGYRYYDWNVDSDDAGSAKNKDDIYKNVTKGLIKNRSNVVLMHDFAQNNITIDALKDIIKYGKENGYEFKAITETNDPVVHHRVNN